MIICATACILLAENPPAAAYEIILVDNASSDGTLEMLRAEFPTVQVIVNDHNTGYTAPMNQALRQGSGRYLMQLNPDTLVPPGALHALLEFMDAHPEVGICGPKVLNADGSLQKSCRRGNSRPWAVISYFLGLSRLFPRSKFFGGYHQNHLPEDDINPVDGVAGSCMLIRREVVDQIGFLDERLFCLSRRRGLLFPGAAGGLAGILCANRSHYAFWRARWHPRAAVPFDLRLASFVLALLP